jgi:putative sterol carrier protein
MTKWLSTEWFDQTRSLAAALPERTGLSAGIQYQVIGGPAGDPSYYCVLEDGRPVRSGLGSVDDPEVTLTLGWDTAVAVHGGRLDPNVAFMQGGMKVAGSMAVMIRLLAVARAPESQDLRRRIGAVTEF